ncbi:MAG: hypothetical protein CMJ58_24835 [Planctomycetaceae bacterium]|nr:hypothetical protein [Planctomycetaceae bacterium]
MSYFKGLLAAAVVCSLVGPATAATLIDPLTNNGSFEFAGGAINTTKIQVWDTGALDVDNWVEWAGVSTAGDDSGVENTGNASDGTMVAFLQPGNAVHNMTSYVAAEGDEFYFSWDHVLRGDRDHTVSLVYDNGGTITSLVPSEKASTGVIETISNTYVIPSGSPAIGKTIGLGIVSPGSYPEIDNFILTVNELAPVDGDVDGDFDVDLDDYAIIRDNFRLSPATKAQGDITGGDIVDLADFLFWRNAHAAASGAASAGIPEPASAALALLGAVAFATLRKRR